MRRNVCFIGLIIAAMLLLVTMDSAIPWSSYTSSSTSSTNSSFSYRDSPGASYDWHISIVPQLNTRQVYKKGDCVETGVGLVYSWMHSYCSFGRVTSTIATCTGPPGEITYRINSASFIDWVGDSSLTTPETQIVQPIIHAADTWNSQGTTGYFTYLGDSNYEIPDPDDHDARDSFNASFCQNFDATGLIVVDPYFDTENASAGFNSRCEDSGVRTKWILRIKPFPRDPCNDGPYFFAPVDGTDTKYDGIRWFIHELGHALKLQHPDRDEEDPSNLNRDVGSVMEGGSPKLSIRRRDLFRWDLECSYKVAGNQIRDVPLKVVEVDGDNIGNPIQFSTGAAKYSTGASYNTTNAPQYQNIFFRKNLNKYWRWFRDSNPSDYITIGEINDVVGMGPREIVFRETSPMRQIQHLFYSDHRDLFANSDWDYSEFGNHPLLNRYFSKSIAKGTPIPSYLMKHCTSMAANSTENYLACGDRDNIYTARPVVGAWDPINQKTVFAWVDQDRAASYTDNHHVMVSVGGVDYDTVSEPDDLGVQSSVGVGVACSTEPPVTSTSPFVPCMLAYVDENKVDGKVRLIPFGISWGGNRYVVTTGTEIETDIKTQSDIALWYSASTSKYYLAVRSSEPGQNLEIYRYNPINEAVLHLKSLGKTVAGPTVISYETGPNVLLYLQQP